MKTLSRDQIRVVGAVTLAVGLSAMVWGQGGPPPGAPQGPPPGGGGRGGRGPGAAVTPRQMAPVDLTGTWVSVVTEEWRYRMMTPRKGMDFDGLPMTAAARTAAMSWDPAADEAAGLQCKGYGAPALMRMPGRARINWEDDATLKIEYDTGQQTRPLHFGGRPPAGAQPSWQGYSVAEWELVAPTIARGGFGRLGGAPPDGRGPGGAPPGAGPGGSGGGPGNPFGGAPQLSRSLKVVTTQLRPGYLRKNGVPYGANAVLTEYFDLRTEPNGDNWFTVVSIVDDSENLGGAGTYMSSSDFKKEADGSKWDADAVQREVKDMARLKILSVLWAGVILAGIPTTARAQVDLSGFWSNPNFEDVMERIDGPAIGDFTGLPITAAGRRAGETWDAGILSVPEHQCQDYPADYQSNSTWSFDMWKEVDPATHATVAWRTRLQYMSPERTIWMDGRPHPDDEAPHTWEGFSTGRWEGGSLIVTTTHLKTSWLRRNGVPRSDKATVVERFTRHGNYLSVVTTVYDPIYMSEPYVRSRDMVLNPAGSMGVFVCETAEEVARPRGVIPHVLPGDNKYLTEFTVTDGVPAEAARGGAETLYPEYRAKLATLPVPRPPAANTPPQTPPR